MFKNSTACKWFVVTVPSTRWCSCLLVSPHVAHGVGRVFAQPLFLLFVLVSRMTGREQRPSVFTNFASASSWATRFENIWPWTAFGDMFCQCGIVFDLSLSFFFAFAGQWEIWWAVCRTGLQIRLQMPPRERQQGESVHFILLITPCLRSTQYVSSLMV